MRNPPAAYKADLMYHDSRPHEQVRSPTQMSCTFYCITSSKGSKHMIGQI